MANELVAALQQSTHFNSMLAAQQVLSLLPTAAPAGADLAQIRQDIADQLQQQQQLPGAAAAPAGNPFLMQVGLPHTSALSESAHARTAMALQEASAAIQSAITGAPQPPPGAGLS